MPLTSPPMSEPSTPAPARCGAWPSPLTPEAMAAGSVAPGFAAMARGRLHWVEGRPAERGRSALLTHDDRGAVVEVLGEDADVRSRVHEYGGLAWAAVGDAPSPRCRCSRNALAVDARLGSAVGEEIEAMAWTMRNRPSVLAQSLTRCRPSAAVSFNP